MGLMNSFFNWYHDNGIIPNIWKGVTGQLSQEKINNENLDYQRERNAIEDARYEDETAYNRAFAEDERDYNRVFAEDERDYNRAFAEEERAYNRAFAEDEKSYQRTWAQDERAYQRDWALNERDYQRSLQQTIFDREDTAIARQAEALRSQGINPASQNMNGLGSGSIVSSSAPGSSAPGSSAPGSSSPGSSSVPGSVSVPALSGRGGKALQKAMITSQGINGLLAPILQAMNTIDSLKGNGIQRDLLNAQAVKTQAEANISLMNMFDTADRLNLKDNTFYYGVNKNKQYSFNVNPDTYNPYNFTPQMLNDLEGKTKIHQYKIFGYDAKLKKFQSNKLDSVGDSMTYLTDKLMDKGSDELLDTLTGVLEKLLLKSLHLDKIK